ncbi:hypothetical protein V6Z11_A12G202300 [Gossypium hirsutum]
MEGPLQAGSSYFYYNWKRRITRVAWTENEMLWN